MAQGDARRIPTITADSEGKPDLNSVQEAVRQLAENIYKIEGRVGEVTLRDDLRVMGGFTLPARVSGTNSEFTTPSTSATHEGRIYFDGSLNKFRVSESTGAYTNLVGITALKVKVLYSNGTQVPNVGGSTTDFYTYTMPKGTLATDGDGIHIQSTCTFAANANANKGLNTLINGSVQWVIGGAGFVGNSFIGKSEGWLWRRGTSLYWSTLVTQAQFPTVGVSNVFISAGTLAIDPTTTDLAIKVQGFNSAGSGDTTVNQTMITLHSQ